MREPDFEEEENKEKSTMISLEMLVIENTIRR